MNRSKFIKQSTAALFMTSLLDLPSLIHTFDEEDELMPALFIGHGSPMNAIEDNEFTRGWKEISSGIPKPKAIICISAHWLTKGTYVTYQSNPETIHDFGGFPDELFSVQYPAKGNPELADELIKTVQHPPIFKDEQWGLDHGTWSITKPMFPKADIPIIQLSIDYNQPPIFHYELGRQLAQLRKHGILIIGSGNMIHHLGMVNFNKPNEGEPWADEINEIFKKEILDGNHQAFIQYQQLHSLIKNAIPTPDHYYPLLYTLALQQKTDDVKIFNDKTIYGSLSMTSVKFG